MAMQARLIAAIAEMACKVVRRSRRNGGKSGFAQQWKGIEHRGSPVKRGCSFSDLTTQKGIFLQGTRARPAARTR